jgi:hypothetical protein
MLLCRVSARVLRALTLGVSTVNWGAADAVIVNIQGLTLFWYTADPQ